MTPRRGSTRTSPTTSVRRAPDLAATPTSTWRSSAPAATDSSRSGDQPRDGQLLAPRPGALLLAGDQVALLVDEKALRPRRELAAVLVQQPPDLRRRAPGHRRRGVDAGVERRSPARQRAQRLEP